MQKKFLKEKRKGFTLIELVVVIAIIAILSAILFPNLSGFIKESRKMAVTKEAREIVHAAEAAKIKYSSNITPNIKTSELFTRNDFKNYLDPNQIKTIPSSDTLLLKDLYNVLDTENYTFEIDNDNKLKEVKEITS